jgi:hypothetical protein
MICSMISSICLLGGQAFSLDLGLTGSNMGELVGHTFDECGMPFCQESWLMWQLLDLYDLEALFDALLIIFRSFCADIVSGDFCSLIVHSPDCSGEYHFRGRGSLGSGKVPGSKQGGDLLLNIASNAFPLLDKFGLINESSCNSPRISKACCIPLL